VLSNNPRLGGTIPDGLGSLAELAVLEVERTAMRGRPLAVQGGGAAHGLPCFLQQLQKDVGSQIGYKGLL
jgi:hypothetical protein